ncbi:amino acid permease [Pseudonocardiaceae bacterium YIM PH 21723]|nr:amino acid permease [Pseudonocardiaceae bacterium YIM PH 21723]
MSETVRVTAEPTGQLRRDLSGRQIGMIALGGAIGTGLFLGSGLAISLAGPAVVFVYAAAAVVALALAYALAEMVAVHPDAGGFGALAHRYLGPGAGFVQRWMYWLAVIANIGSEAVAAALYLRYWWPQLPLWTGVVVLSLAMIAVNAVAVRFFGEFEYWFAMIKVVVIVAFVLLGGCYIFLGLPGKPAIGASILTGSGLAPTGFEGIWLALTVVTFSYLGTEAVSITAGESRDPHRDLPRATRRMVLRLSLFYVLAMAVVVTVVPWQDTAAAGGLDQSPFVKLFDLAGIPAAAAIMNFVVLTAALSAMNTNLYVATRMTYSLATDRMAPSSLAKLNANGIPVRSLALATLGLVAAVLVATLSPDTAYPLLISLALFTALVTWFLIFGTHLAFRRRAGELAERPPIRLAGAPYTTITAMVFVLAVIVTTAFTKWFSLAWQVGVPFLFLLILIYLVIRRRSTASAR